ncbi:MAG: DUF6912 family protein [Sporichthyaceae bacterium]
MRVYLPVTMPGLAASVAAGEFTGPGLAFAVTPALREWYASGDAEELEYAAMTDAARHCLRLLAADRSAPPRRVVVVAEVADAAVSQAPELHPAAVALRVAVALQDVVAVHVDDLAAGSDVRAGADASAAADAGDDDATFTVETVEDHELAWYATQEIEALLAEG